MLTSIAGRSVIVTGASKGIGKGIARVFASKGARVLVVARNQAAAQKTADEFKAAGGQILFGTDVGYMNEFDPTAEYVFMAKAGLSPMEILASLTTAPAERWKESARRGRVEAGMDADLVVLGGDPAEDVRNFTNVRCVFRAGKLVYAPSESK